MKMLFLISTIFFWSFSSFALNAPVGLTTKALSSSQIQIKFADRSVNETAFIIERSNNSDSGFKAIGRVGKNVISYIDSNLKASTTFLYRVRGIKENINPVVYSNYSNISSSQTLVAIPLPGQISFWGDWESEMVTGDGNKNWSNLQAVAPDRFRLIKDNTRSGTYARVEVRHGDDPIGDGSTERSEVVTMQKADSSELNENLNSGTKRHSFSVKFDRSWQTIADIDGNGAWGIFLQLHGPDDLDTNPAFAPSATDKIRFDIRAGDIRTTSVREFDLLNGNLNKGHWIDFIVTIKYAKNKTGFVDIKRRRANCFYPDATHRKYAYAFNMIPV